MKRLSVDCAFEGLRASLIKDRIISGIQSAELKDRLLREDNLTLEKCVKLFRAAELASQQVLTLKEQSRNVDAVKFQNKQKSDFSRKGPSNQRTQQRNRESFNSSSTDTRKMSNSQPSPNRNKKQHHLLPQMRDQKAIFNK